MIRIIDHPDWNRKYSFRIGRKFYKIRLWLRKDNFFRLDCCFDLIFDTNQIRLNEVCLHINIMRGVNKIRSLRVGVVHSINPTCLSEQLENCLCCGILNVENVAGLSDSHVLLVDKFQQSHSEIRVNHVILLSSL